jgi:hypothetical protein
MFIMSCLLLLIGLLGSGPDLDFYWIDELHDVQKWQARPDWLSHPDSAATVTSNGRMGCFRVTLPGHGMKWSLPVKGVWLDETPYLLIRYKAENLVTDSDDYFVFADDHRPKGQLNAIRLSDVESDGKWHLLAANVRALTEKDSIDELAIQVQANRDGNARLWVDFIQFAVEVPKLASLIQRSSELQVAPDQKLVLANAKWVAHTDWLENPATAGTCRCEHQSGILRFCIDDAGHGMKWSCPLDRSIELAGHRYVTMRYRATGARAYSDYTVAVIGTQADGQSGYMSVVPTESLRIDGRWHRLDLDVRDVAAELPTFDTVAVQLQASGPDAKLEIADLELVQQRPKNLLSDMLPAQPGVDDARFRQVDLEKLLTTPLAPWRSRLRLDTWYSDERIQVAGIPMRLSEANRVMSTSIHQESELAIPVESRTSEVYFLLMATFRGLEEPAFGNGTLTRIQDLDRFRVRLEYADGNVDEWMPMDAVTGLFGVQTGVQMLVAGANPNVPLRQVVIEDRSDQMAVAVAALSLRVDGQRTFPQVWEEMAPLQVRSAHDSALEPALAFSIDTEGLPCWTRLTQQPEGWQFIDAPTPIVRLEIGDRLLSAEDFQPVESARGPGGERSSWYKLAGAADLYLRLDIEQRDRQSIQITTRLENRSSEPCTVSLTAPWIADYQLGQEPAESYYLVPRRGAILNNAPCDFRERYCGLFPVQFLDTFSPLHGRGLTVRTADMHCQRKNYLLKKTGNRLTMGVEYPQVALAPGDFFQTAPAILTVTNGDWRTGLTNYRRWIRTWFEPLTPRKEWFRQVFNFRQRFLWMWDPMYDPDLGVLDLEQAVREAQREFGGIDYLHLFDWGNCPGVGRIYGRTGDYSPYDHLAGGRAMLRDAINGVQADGVRVGLYIEGYLLQERGKLGKEYGPAWQLIGRDGEGKYWPNSSEMFICPAVADWREVQASTYATKVNELGVDGMYIDQFGFAGSEKDCWSRDHGHPAPSYAVATEQDCTRMIRERVEAARPGVAIYTEESPVDVTAQLQDGSFTYAMFSSKRSSTLVPLNLFRFAIPDFKTIEILYCDKPTGSWATGVKWVFFNGEALWLEGKADEWFKPRTRATIRKCYEILRRYREAFTTLKPVPLVPTEVGGVYANAFPSRRGTVYTFYNSRHHTVRGPVIRLPHRDGTRYIDAWQGRLAKTQRSDHEDLITLEIGPMSVGCLVVEESK